MKFIRTAHNDLFNFDHISRIELDVTRGSSHTLLVLHNPDGIYTIALFSYMEDADLAMSWLIEQVAKPEVTCVDFAHYGISDEGATD